ncbi:MAG: acyltransferase, partial [Candidatus Omnitrophica bacterium]|nr:acyltransferase [Candidatus Omnitrophota bacterium]
MKDAIRVASVQFEHAPGNKDANFSKIVHFTEKAAGQNVELVVFPECCITGYWFIRNLDLQQLISIAEPVFTGESCRKLSQLSKTYNISIGAGLIEITDKGKLHNTYIIAMPNGRMVKHRKIHSFEHEAITPGDSFTVFDLPGGIKAGILICYDNNIVENVRITALLGAKILIAPHQTGGCKSGRTRQMGLIDRSLWDNRKINPFAIEKEFRGPKGRMWLMRWLPSRAHDNGIFFIFSNGVGVDDDEIRTGNAMILDPYGEIIVETCKA